MQSESHDLLARYNALTVADQTVLQALSALYEPASANVVSSCLTSANCRESPMRAFNAQSVAVRLARLGKLGVAEAVVPVDGNRNIQLWHCRPAAGELAIRHAARDGLFNALARAALAGTRGRDWAKEGAGESLRRALRLDFHAGCWRTALMNAELLDAETPGASSALLSSIIQVQPDESWLPSTPNEEAGRLLALCLSGLILNLADPAAVLAAAERLMGRGVAALSPALGETLTLCGKWREADRLAAGASPETAAGIRQFIAFIHGDDAASLEFSAIALAAQRRRNATRAQLLDGHNGVWQALAMLRTGSPENLGKLEKILPKTSDDAGPHAAEYSYIRQSALFCLGQSFAARVLPEDPAKHESLTVLLHGLATLWIHPARLPGLHSGFESMRIRARAGGYRWLAAQFAALADRAAGVRAGSVTAADWPLLADAFADRDKWRRGLAALDEFAAGRGPEQIPGRRVIWLVEPNASPPDPYCPFSLRPLEQVMGKTGWTKGRNISLRRLFQNRQEFDYATGQDRMAFSTLVFSETPDGSVPAFDAGRALECLIGHPLVFRDDSGGAKMDVVAGEFEVSAVSKDGGVEIAMEPPLTEFLSGFDVAGPVPPTPPGIAARLETPTRLRVMRLGEREKRLARIVGDGMAIPSEGREEAISTLSALTKRMRVQSDIPELASGGETLDADPTPRFHLLPLNPGLKIEVWSHPLGDDGPAYRPGRGGRILSTDSTGGSCRIVRDLQREKELADHAVTACPSLAGNAECDLSWRLDDPEACLEFLVEAGELGESVVLAWPKGGRFRVRRLANPANLGITVSHTSEWLELDGSVKIDETLTIGMEKLLHAARNAIGRFVVIGEGEFLALTTELRRQLADIEAFADARGGGLRLPLLAGGLVEDLEALGVDVAADTEWRAFLERRGKLADFAPPVPAGFRGELRDYQLDGYRWMARLAEWGAGACLADDMGLGKTVQTLALLVHRAPLGPALAVAPTSVCHNWLAEARRFAPSLNAIAFGEGDRGKMLSRLGAGDLLVASYGLLQQEEALAGVEWATAVLDEAQAIKNIATKRSKAAMDLKAGFRLITTGTPIENHLGELWNLFRFVNPHLLGPWRRFQERFVVPVERRGDAGAGDGLRRVIRPFILRRSKNQVLGALPPKTEITLKVEMGPEERACYEALRRQALERLSGAEGGMEEKRFQILAEIMKLRRACCSPELVAGGAGIPSAKQEQFGQTLDELIANRHKALVFSQFVSHLEIIRRHLDKRGIGYQYLDGSTPARMRKQAVEAFQAGNGDVFLISLKAGGLGLNLTAADYVIHMDPWWNPAVEDQASDRAHRIGQTRPVTVYRLVAAGTIEEKIVELHRRKRDLADTLLSGTDQAHAMDLAEIMSLLRGGPEPVP